VRRRGPSSTAEQRAGAVERTRVLAESGEIGDAVIERTLISGLLEEEFGANFVNDAQFQKVVDDVRAAIAGDPDGRLLMQRAVAALRPK
jgi:hypothetical protein